MKKIKGTRKIHSLRAPAGDWSGVYLDLVTVQVIVEILLC